MRGAVETAFRQYKYKSRWPDLPIPPPAWKRVDGNSPGARDWVGIDQFTEEDVVEQTDQWEPSPVHFYSAYASKVIDLVPYEAILVPNARDEFLSFLSRAVAELEFNSILIFYSIAIDTFSLKEVLMRTNAETDRLSEKFSAANVAAWCDLFHSENSAYIDPVFGKFEGQAAIQRWLVEMMGRAGRWKAHNIGSRFFDGHIAAGESVLSIPIGPSDFELPFAWIRRYEDGYIVYRRDYFDTHELRKNAGAHALREPENGI